MQISGFVVQNKVNQNKQMQLNLVLDHSPDIIILMSTVPDWRTKEWRVKKARINRWPLTLTLKEEKENSLKPHFERTTSGVGGCWKAISLLYDTRMTFWKTKITYMHLGKRKPCRGDGGKKERTHTLEYMNTSSFQWPLNFGDILFEYMNS